MTPLQLTSFLHNNIPLTAAMQVEVRECGENRLLIAAPLAPNRNHHGTAFGGSLAVLGIIACWSLLHHALTRRGIAAKLVVQKNECEYFEPVGGEILAHSTLPAVEWEAFVSTLQQKKRARIVLQSEIHAGTRAAVKSTGTFVAIISP